jgi:transcriptional regulator with XRE-family HTH domain
VDAATVSDGERQVVATVSLIRAIRREQELSQMALAHRSGIDPRHLSELERHNKKPGLRTVMRLIAGLGMTNAEFWGRFDEREGERVDAAE